MNGDEEIDFVERKNQAFKGFDRNVHAGLAKDKNGAFYYITSKGMARLKYDKYEICSPPLRTAMGMGITHDDRLWSAPQEGGATPASGIFEYHDGDDLYRPQMKGTPEQFRKEMAKVDPALVYLPRGLDNSTACALAVRSDRFGVLGDKMLSFSYGACATQIVLRDRAPGAKRFQGAAIPLPGYFYSGINHGAVNPKDGQVYVVGHDGWGSYAVADGCLQRIRHTGRKSHYPTAFRIFENGIQLDFEHPLDAKLAGRADKWFAQQWNYAYSPAYGSPEYSVNNPDRLGHDHLPVKSVQVRKNGKQVFVEIPDIKPAMNIHLYGETGENRGEEVEIFLTALHLAKSENSKVASKANNLVLPYKLVKEREKYIAPDDRKRAKHIVLGSNDTLQFIADAKAKESLKNIRVGDMILFEVKNLGLLDAMAHNAIVVRSADAAAVGMAADAMMANPDAISFSYVPMRNKEVKDKILAYSTLAYPRQSKEFLFEAKSKGKYSILCTFPGHWRLMQLHFEVK